MAFTPEIIAEIQLLREKSRAGTMTLDDVKRGIELLRQDRLAMPPTASKSKNKLPAVNEASLLSELDNL